MKVEVCGKVVTVTPSRRSKRLRMRVTPPDGQICVSCPLGTKIGEVERFVKANEKWIVNATKKVKVDEDKKTYLQGGNKFILFGKIYDVIEIENKQYNFILGNETCIFSYPKDSTMEQKQAYLKKVMKDVAKETFAPLVKKYEEIIGVRSSGISYRFITSRWGSCNHNTRKINFSVYAIQKPIEYVEYLVCHELLHIIYPNHGKKFKASLSKIIPNAEEISKLK